MNRYLLVAVAVTSFGTGWFIKDKIADAQIAETNLATVETLKSISLTAANKQKEMQNELDQMQAEWAAVEAEQYALLRDAEMENNKLRADVDAGRKRLRVNASCPTNSDRLPETSTGASMDNGATAELNRDARQDYYSLREGIERVTRQLLACQSRLGE